MPNIRPGRAHHHPRHRPRVLGPGKLPDVGAALGKSIREFRKASSDIAEATPDRHLAAPAGRRHPASARRTRRRPSPRPPPRRRRAAADASDDADRPSRRRRRRRDPAADDVAPTAGRARPRLTAMADADAVRGAGVPDRPPQPDAAGPGRRPPSPATVMTLVDHLTELRNRLVRCAPRGRRRDASSGFVVARSDHRGLLAAPAGGKLAPGPRTRATRSRSRSGSRSSSGSSSRCRSCCTSSGRSSRPA